MIVEVEVKNHFLRKIFNKKFKKQENKIKNTLEIGVFFVLLLLE